MLSCEAKLCPPPISSRACVYTAFTAHSVQTLSHCLWFATVASLSFPYVVRALPDFVTLYLVHSEFVLWLLSLATARVNLSRVSTYILGYIPPLSGPEICSMPSDGFRLLVEVR